MKIFSYWKPILARLLSLESFPRQKKNDVLPSVHNLFFLFIRERMWQKQTGLPPSFFPPRSSFFPGAATLMTHSATVTVALQCKSFLRSEQGDCWVITFLSLWKSEKCWHGIHWHGLQKKVHFQRVLLPGRTESPNAWASSSLKSTTLELQLQPKASSDSQRRSHWGKINHKLAKVEKF